MYLLDNIPQDQIEEAKAMMQIVKEEAHVEEFRSVGDLYREQWLAKGEKRGRAEGKAIGLQKGTAAGMAAGIAAGRVESIISLVQAGDLAADRALARLAQMRDDNAITPSQYRDAAKLVRTAKRKRGS